jgi:hypothetical protein
MDRIFLGIVGVAYIVLAGWCSLFMEKTSKAVGFDLQPGQGQSEFLTVYGGLELALGLIFLWPVYRPEEAAFPLFVCVIVHGCLVVFRTAGFFLYSGFSTTTYFLAATEWIIFLGTAVLCLRKM